MVSPVSAPILIRTENQVSPITSTAFAIGSATLSWVYGTSPVSTAATAIYSSVEMTSDPQNADGHVALRQFRLLR